MTTHLRLLTTVALTSLCFTSYAQTAAVSNRATPQPAGSTAFEEFLREAKNPTDWLSWGADFRPRNEYYHEIVSLTEGDDLHEQDVTRFRTRLWATATVITNVTLNARVSAEPRLWNKPSFVTVFKGNSGMEWRYGIIDNLNAKWDHILGTSLSISAGRQDVQMGDPLDWWLVADGTPADGSWTFFLDSVRMGYAADSINTKLDLIYIHQSAHPSDWLPTLGNSSEYSLVEQHERGVILYASNKSIKNTQVDGYFIYKHDDREDFSIQGNRKFSGDNADIYTLGGKITGTPAPHWLYSLEGAYQFGQKEDTILGVRDARQIDAFGGKGKLTYALLDPMKNQFSLTGEFLSGDDKSTDSDEMFDILWGRWPRWSELYVYSYIVETGGRIAQMNNIARIGPMWSIRPLEKLTFSAAYNVLLAPESTPTRALNPGAFSGNGNFRGHYAQTVLRYQFSKNVAAHLWGEGIWEGDYYKNRDFLSFVRAEVLFTF